MNAVIYICHGSRVTAGIEQAAVFIRECMKRVDVTIQEYCFLELAKPTIEEAFRRCVNNGATKIAVIPVLLLTAAHAKKDIPNELNRLSALFPNVEVKYGEPIGVHPKMISPLIERMMQTKEKVDENSMALLIGRGSSDPDVKRDLNSMARLLHDFTDIGDVNTCFLTAASPSLEDGLQMAGESGYDKVFIVPYLLFPGILMQHISEVIEKHPYRKKFYLCNCIGYHSVIEDILVAQSKKMLMDK